MAEADHTTRIKAMTPLQAIAELRDYDHIFISKEGCLAFGAVFGLVPLTEVRHADPTNPKGLTFNDGATVGEGLAAEDLADKLCRHVGCPTPFAMGRGFRLRQACDSLQRHFETPGR